MDRDFAQFVLDVPLENFYLVMALGVLRTFGLLFGFLAFGWGLGRSVSLRIGIAFSLSLPFMFSVLEQVDTLAEQTNPLNLALIGIKEFFIGFALGLLASGPFRAMQYAGAISDAFRGEAESGVLSPEGTPIQTFSLLYTVIGFSVFFAMGGLWHLIEILYRTYDIWPLDAPLPTFYGGAPDIALAALNDSLKLAIQIAAPLMILLFSVELILMVATKLGRRFNLYSMSFLVKNMLTLLMLPLMAIVIVQVAEENGPNVRLALPTLEGFFE